MDSSFTLNKFYELENREVDSYLPRPQNVQFLQCNLSQKRFLEGREKILQRYFHPVNIDELAVEI